jgi:SPP1 gp7 family putative phage head morphogenesis protein
MFKKFTLDAKKEKTSKFSPSRAAENEFVRSLKKIAKASGHIVEHHVDGHQIVNEPAMKKALADYSRAVTPWAKRQSQKLLGATLKRINSDKSYREHAKRIGKVLSEELFERENGLVVMSLLNEQVNLIQSIPLEAGERAQKLAMEAVAGGRRADEIASELMKTTEVTEARAKLIARTETARANTALNLARATEVGSTQYTWVTSGDASVRDSHKKMNGKVFEWDNPPTLSDGETGHPGTFPNCRCYAEPILPDN